MNAVYAVCVLLLAVTVDCQNPVCYHPGITNCQQPSGGWLMAMEESRLRAQGREPTIAELEVPKKIYCNCCCKQVPTCRHGEAVCGGPRSCEIKDCYQRILANAAADGSPETPEYTAEILTAALYKQREELYRERSELQGLMESLSYDGTPSLTGADTYKPGGFETEEKDYPFPAFQNA